MLKHLFVSPLYTLDLASCLAGAPRHQECMQVLAITSMGEGPTDAAKHP